MTQWLYLCNDLGIPLDGTKGASEHVRAITRALSQAGQSVHVLAPRGRLPADYPASQIASPCGDEARRLGDDVRSWLALSDAPSGMSAEFSQIAYEARLAKAFNETDLVPQIDVVVERLSLFSAAGRAFARHRGAAYLIEMNSPMANEAAKYRDAGLCSLAQMAEFATLRAADAVMTVSNELRRYVIEEVGVAADRVVTVPNGVELELFSKRHDRTAARRDTRVPLDATVFGFVGSLKSWHGIDVLLRAFSEAMHFIPNAHLLIVGEGRSMQSLRAVSEEHGVADRVTWLGGVEHAEIPRILAAVDVAVAPFLPLETFYFSPLKLYEYMAAGLCVIASRAGQIVELIEDGHNGLLATPGDVASLAEALLRVGRDVAASRPARCSGAAIGSALRLESDRLADH
ncbi:MAG: glycosyltransferase family 4 protein [Planctomycetes bacterium]|nr:glycosyltransferase family 4 protein [Planctomycetota bacterium]